MATGFAMFRSSLKHDKIYLLTSRSTTPYFQAAPTIKKELFSNQKTHVVSCLDVVKIGGPDPWFNWGVSAKVGAIKSF